MTSMLRCDTERKGPNKREATEGGICDFKWLLILYVIILV